MICGRLGVRHPPRSSFKGGSSIEASNTDSALTLNSRSERKKHRRKFGQNEKQNENEVKEKSIAIVMLFSFREPTATKVETKHK